MVVVAWCCKQDAFLITWSGAEGGEHATVVEDFKEEPRHCRVFLQVFVETVPVGDEAKEMMHSCMRHLVRVQKMHNLNAGVPTQRVSSSSVTLCSSRLAAAKRVFVARRAQTSHCVARDDALPS